jgi:hypothetical protein
VAAQAPPGLAATAALDRPAMWVADRVTYTVEIACPRGFDILVEDLRADKLKLTGLDVVASDSTHRDDADGKRYTFRYVLTTFKVDVPAPSIGSFPVRYFIAGAGKRPEEAAPAGSILVPGATVAFRSLLADDQPIYSVRDTRLVPPRWTPFRVMGTVGIGLMLLAIVPVVFLISGLVRRARARRAAGTRPSPRQVRQAARLALEEIRGLDATTLAARREAFAHLDAAVRHHVSDVCGIATAGLTPEEIAGALEACAGRLPVDTVASVLAACELARYGTPDLQPGSADWQQTLSAAEEVLSAGR